MDSRHGAAAGLRNHSQGETVVLEPFIHTGDLCVYRIASCDAEGLQNLEISPVIDGHLFPGLGYGGAAGLMPGTGRCFYVMDAFGTAHRKHASTAVIADYFDADHKMLGYLMEKEVQAVDNVLKDIKRPFTAIMGGSKVSTKIGIIENLMDKVDNLILCGGMAFTFAKAQGGKIGNSLVEDDKLQLALDIIEKAKAKGVNLVLGCDCIAADKFANDAKTQVCDDKNIPDGWMGLDAGPKTREEFKAAIKGAKTILWNGPAGVFEMDNFAGGSKAIAEAIAEATKEGAFSLIGGGDSVACINKFGMADQVSYISTGGGALLEAIEGKILPGIAAIRGDK